MTCPRCLELEGRANRLDIALHTLTLEYEHQRDANKALTERLNHMEKRKKARTDQVPTSGEAV